jgi:hypothetical protein
MRGRSSSPRRVPLFERASARWWNPQFSSQLLESQYWKCSFPQLRARFRYGLLYIAFTCLLWMTYLHVFGTTTFNQWVTAIFLLPFSQLTCLALVGLCVCMFGFTLYTHTYQRFYMPTSFLCTFVISVVTLLIFADNAGAFMGPVAALATSIQVLHLIFSKFVIVCRSCC